MTGKIDLLIDTIPSAQGVKQFAADNKIGLKELVFYGGEEYEIVATIPRRNLKRAKALATHLKIKLHVIGIATKGSGKVYVLNRRGQYTTLGKYGYVHQFDL
jgi:thiamine-monophosphate kinase